MGLNLLRDTFHSIALVIVHFIGLSDLVRYMVYLSY